MGKVPSCDMENVLSFPLAMSLVRFYFLLSTALLVLPPQEFCGPSKLFFHPRDPLRRPNSCCHTMEFVKLKKCISHLTQNNGF